MSHITIAVAQSYTLSSPAATLAALAATTRRAAAQGADLILFPEAYLGGYPRGADFGCAIGARSDTGREQFLRYVRDAVDLGDTPRGGGDAWVHRRLDKGDHADAASGHDANQQGSSIHGHSSSSSRRRGDGTREELERIARETGVLVVTGLIERAGGSLYCAVVYVDPVRGCIGKRRKVMPTATERLVWAQGQPSSLRAVTATLRGHAVTLAAAICWENYMPLLRTSLYAQGVNIYLAPTADGRETWLPLIRTIAMEGRTFVLSANQCNRKRDLPRWIQDPWVAGSQQNDSTGAAGVQVPSANSQSPIAARSPGSRRRRSTITRTEHNHEITWPACDSKTDAANQPSSITVSEGPHEVCLPALKPSKSASAAPNHASTDTGAVEDTDEAGTAEQTQTEKDSGAAFVSHGGSCIVAPDGSVVAGPLWDDPEGLLISRIDLDDCIRGRLDFDCVGHYSRDDAFELRVRGLDLHPP